eukprot:Blabericola_migrator_1__10939@NODE_6329_length_558_cov_344_906314_g4289_i0_p2_GENE_NODE_6329_length_558_cov_344_906314_g4289_i0NODE_6329_length_558_cov_344_906314_g4289_i0_p2_ORF_typecomplete_len107_score13_39_NODE_6329_length_558_cov_344_906314_g4289_i010330
MVSNPASAADVTLHTMPPTKHVDLKRRPSDAKTKVRRPKVHSPSLPPSYVCRSPSVILMINFSRRISSSRLHDLRRFALKSVDLSVIPRINAVDPHKSHHFEELSR